MRRAIATLTGTIAVLVMLLNFKTQPRATAPRPAAIAPAATGAAPSDAAPPSAAPAGGTTSRAAPDRTGATSASAPVPRQSAKPRAPAKPPPPTTVAGRVIDTRYGPVQVRVTLSGTKIIDVQAVQLPNDRRQSAEISSQAAPLLHDEVLTAQSARIDTVSGATYTSDGYAQSLQSALDKARA